MFVACRSTGKVANLTIKATLSNCILHRRGKLTVEGCKLHCYASGLEHLFTPLVTLATSGLRVQREQLTRPMLTGREAGMGVLSVIETKIRVSMLPCLFKCFHALLCCNSYAWMQEPFMHLGLLGALLSCLSTLPGLPKCAEASHLF